jgi:hypothetical protein
MLLCHLTLARPLLNFCKNFEMARNCKGNLTALRRILHLDLAKGDPK